MVYKLMKRLIEGAVRNGSIDEKKGGYVEKLNAFYMNNQITTEQYNELMAAMEPVAGESEGE